MFWSWGYYESNRTMNDLLGNIFTEYNANSNSKLLLSEKIDLILSEFSIDNDLPIYYVGILYDFIAKEPQYYYNKNVENEVYDNLNNLYDKDKFLNAFYAYLDKFFYSLSSYFSILDLHDEFDDIGLENTTKAKIYYIPLITQLMEFCLNHFYRYIASIEGELKDKDYTLQNTLGKLKNALVKSYPNLLEIDIDFRDAISHGTLEINSKNINYSYTEKGTREEVFKQIYHYDLEVKKNELMDIAGGAFVGFFKFMIEKEILTNGYLESMDEKSSFEFFKLFLHNENVKVKSYTKNTIDSSQFQIYVDILDINDTNQLKHIFVLISKMMFISFPNYDRYIIDYSHPYSIGGMVSFEKDQLEKILYESDISKMDSIIGNGEALLLIPEIQNTFQDNRSYKFHTFPKIKGKDWEVKDLRDISNEDAKRFSAKLIINQESIAKEEVVKLLFLVSKKIRILENKINPTTKIIYGKMEADVVILELFYKTNTRDSFQLLKDDSNFICLLYYYKSKSITKIKVAFQDNYIFEKIKKFDIFWNKGF
jgi:hypothetical protein